MNSSVNRVHRKVAVLLGGCSPEREISLKTGENIAQALKALSHTVTTHDVADNLWEKLKGVKPDVVFIALHGKGGEDGTVQGMLELLNIPYTGSGVLASALAMNKEKAKCLFRDAGIPTPQWLSIKRDSANICAALKQLSFQFPAVVKPNESGSAIGVHIVNTMEECVKAIEAVYKDDATALVEEYLPGREVSVGVLGVPPIPLPVALIVPKNKFYDYEAKYAPGMSDHLIPAPLPESLYKEVQSLALKAHEVLGCHTFSRTDIWVSHEKGPLVLEVNTIPGMTGTSLYPEMLKAAGIEFPEFLERCLDLAIVNQKVFIK